jgi:hypothetical protein
MAVADSSDKRMRTWLYRRCTFLAVMLGLFSSSLISQEAPKGMIKITTRLIEPEPERGSFGAQPRTLWRAGKKYGRIAEGIDNQQHIHGLMIISEPDAWMINLYDKSGRHVIDPGPSLEVHVPIFQTPGEAKSKLNELEFFKANHASESAGEPLHGSQTSRYELTLSGRTVILWVHSKTEKPIRISLAKGSDRRTIEYLAYEHLPFDPALFQPPRGITLVDAK